MHGSLALHQGVLYVGRYAKTAWVATYDLDGHALETSFAFRDEKLGRSAVGGLDVDTDHRVWVADTSAGRVRAFTLFGQQVVDIGDTEWRERERHGERHGERQDERQGGRGEEDRLGLLGTPNDVLIRGADEELQVVVCSAGSRRHAVQVFQAHAGRVRSLRPLGDPRGQFHGAVGLAVEDDLLYVCERGVGGSPAHSAGRTAGRVQVFKDDEFHFAIQIPVAGGARFEPVAAALLPDGRSVIATAGEASGLLLVDRAGRLVRVLAEAGSESGRLTHPGDVVIARGEDEQDTRVLVIDQDGGRVQVFTLDGRCYGAFTALTGS